MNRFRSLVVRESYFGDHYDSTTHTIITKLPGGITREETEDTILYHKNGKLHRTDGPAWIRGDYMAWFFNGRKHRDGGPAVYYGSEERTPRIWYKHGMYHRLDGPAVEFEHNPDRNNQYWVNGKEFTKEEFYKHFGDLEESKRLGGIKINTQAKWILDGVIGAEETEIIKKLKDGGHKITKRYMVLYLDKDGNYHRTDGPAIINRDLEYEAWYIHGKPHRTDGPAITDKFYKYVEYWVNGKFFSETDFYKHFGDKKNKLASL